MNLPRIMGTAMAEDDAAHSTMTKLAAKLARDNPLDLYKAAVCDALHERYMATVVNATFNVDAKLAAVEKKAAQSRVQHHGRVWGRPIGGVFKRVVVKGTDEFSYEFEPKVAPVKGADEGKPKAKAGAVGIADFDALAAKAPELALLWAERLVLKASVAEVEADDAAEAAEAEAEAERLAAEAKAAALKARAAKHAKALATANAKTKLKLK